MDRVLAGALAALVAGLVLRVTAGTVVLRGGGPHVRGRGRGQRAAASIKRDFSSHAGTMMGVYTMALSASAAVAAGTTAPLGALLGQGWRGALGIWAVPAAVVPTGSVLGEGLAWQVTAFFGLVGLGFHALLVWLPSIYRDQGFTDADRAAGYRYEISVLQAEFSLTQMLDRPVSGRIFFEQVIRDNLDIGRPDQVHRPDPRLQHQRPPTD